MIYLTYIKVNDASDFKFDQVEKFQGISLPETTHFLLWL